MLNDQQELELKNLFDEVFTLLDDSIIPSYSPDIRYHLKKFINSLQYDCKEGLIDLESVHSIQNNLINIIQQTIRLNLGGTQNYIDNICDLLLTGYRTRDQEGNIKEAPFFSSWSIFVTNLTFFIIFSLTVSFLALAPRLLNPLLLTGVGFFEYFASMGSSIFLVTPRELASLSIRNQFKNFSNNIYGFFTHMKPEQNVAYSRNYYELAKKIVTLIEDSKDIDEKQISLVLKEQIKSLYQSDAVVKKDIHKGNFLQRLFDIHIVRSREFDPETLREYLDTKLLKETIKNIINEIIKNIKSEESKPEPSHHTIDIGDQYMRLA